MPRRSHVPEDVNYRDTGCEVAPACLACPLPRCRYDDPRGLVGQFMARKASEREAICAAFDAGSTVDMIAEMYGMSRRNVFRILKARQDATLSA